MSLRPLPVPGREGAVLGRDERTTADLLGVTGPTVADGVGRELLGLEKASSPALMGTTRVANVLNVVGDVSVESEPAAGRS